MESVLVTGGAGFIGSHVAAHLLKRGYDVHILDRMSYAGKNRNLPKGVKIWLGDLKEWDVCLMLAEYNFDYIVHLASNTHVDHSITNPIAFTKDNVLATNQFLHALEVVITGGKGGSYSKIVHEKKYKVPKKIICYSTDEVFGSTPPGERFNENQRFNPSNAYSASKVGIEGVVRSYFVTHGMPVIIVRPCNTYGNRQHPEKVIPKFIRQAALGTPLTIHNDGTGARDWLHTSDHAKAIEVLMLKGVPGEAYNLAAGDEHNDLEVANRIVTIVNPKCPVQFVPGRPGHDRRYWMANAKLRALGWKPEMPFEKGFDDTVKWNIANPDWWEHDYTYNGGNG